MDNERPAKLAIIEDRRPPVGGGKQKQGVMVQVAAYADGDIRLSLSWWRLYRLILSGRGIDNSWFFSSSLRSFVFVF